MTPPYRIMGIVNVTPDSFSDGGLHLDPAAAEVAARRMVEEGAAIVDEGGGAIGRVTSGTVGPSVGKPVALAYVPSALAAVGTPLDADVRGKRQPMQVATLPFSPHRYFRG